MSWRASSEKRATHRKMATGMNENAQKIATKVCRKMSQVASSEHCGQATHRSYWERLKIYHGRDQGWSGIGFLESGAFEKARDASREATDLSVYARTALALLSKLVARCSFMGGSRTVINS